jgi:histidine triad (HIT) family protein
MSDCIFCKIIAKEIPGTIVYEDDLVLAFNDIHPLAPVHVLIIPKKHIESLNDINEEDQALLGHLLIKAKEVAKSFNIAETGYRVITNIGKDGNQVIKHLHFHILGGKHLGSKLG